MYRLKVALLLMVLMLLSSGLAACGGAEKQAAATPSPTPMPVGVYLTPATQQANPGQDVTVQVEVNPGQRGVAGGRIHLAYDNSVLSVTSISPGFFFGATPLVGFKDVDEEAGVLGYMLARVGNTTVPSSPGIFATVKFHVLEQAGLGNSSVTIKYIELGDENTKSIDDIGVADAVIEIIPE